MLATGHNGSVQPEQRRSTWQSMLERQSKPRLKSPFARAVVPVAAGLAFFAALFGALWLVAALSSKNGQPLGSTQFNVGRIDAFADKVAEDGPLLFQGLEGTSGKFSIVLDHSGVQDASGWTLYAPFAADAADDSCLVEQVVKTRRFTDCAGRTLEVEQLRPADFAEVVIEGNRNLIIRLKSAQQPSTNGG
jgi:hypothetical protein